MDYSALEFMGRRECPKCLYTCREESRWQDAYGRRIGKYILTLACRCYGERKGEVLDEQWIAD